MIIYSSRVNIFFWSLLAHPGNCSVFKSIFVLKLVFGALWGNIYLNYMSHRRGILYQSNIDVKTWENQTCWENILGRSFLHFTRSSSASLLIYKNFNMKKQSCKDSRFECADNTRPGDFGHTAPRVYFLNIIVSASVYTYILAALRTIRNNFRRFSETFNLTEGEKTCSRAR